MEAHEALERFEKAHEHEHEEEPVSGLARQAALMVAVVAAFLAIATFLGNESVKDAIQGQTKVSDAHSQQATFDTQDLVFQSDQSLFIVMSHASDPGLSRTARAANKSLTHLAKQVPGQERALQKTVTDEKSDVNHANNQHLLYEIAEVLLQIAIVLASVAIIARRRFLLLGGGAISAVGVVILVVGFVI
jgi:hypothetical protein